MKIVHSSSAQKVLRLGSADLVRIFAHDFIAALRSHLAQVEQLRFDVLIDCASRQEPFLPKWNTKRLPVGG